MITYVYERLSQSVHNYSVPSERSSYNPAVWTSLGYFVLQPDIFFRGRRPGTSALECIRPAVQTVVDTGMVDGDHVGLVGHSWGGYEAAYVPTQTDIFAASVSGAALTNFFSMFGTVHWNQGLPEASHFETGQARMDVPYWDDMEAYVRESPVMGIPQLETPMLMAFGDSDGTVDWHQGVEMYNYARRAGKMFVMLVYADENHSNRQEKNQVDYHHRILDWFGHYLKGQPAKPWITDGVSVMERNDELKRRGRQR
jgi:dipeptidyl aminopeptidase/acylaminoacyl peptidase